MPKICRGRLAILRGGRCMARHDLAAGMDRRRPVLRSGHGEPAGAPSLVWAGPQLRRLGRIVALFAALVVSLTLAAAASATFPSSRPTAGALSTAPASLRPAPAPARPGSRAAAPGSSTTPHGVATDRSGDVYVADDVNNRIDEFSAAGAFIKAYGWGVVDGASQFETCTSTCQAGIVGRRRRAARTTPRASPSIARATSTSPMTATTGSMSSPPPARSSRPTAGALSTALSQFETCTSTCQAGIAGGGAGQFDVDPAGVATDSSGDVYVADNGNNRIDEFSAAGAFIKAYGWGVVDGASQFETCTSTCQAGIAGGGAGQLDSPEGVATDSSGDVYVADDGNERIDEFSAAGAFIKAYGWGVSDGASQFETCTSTCQAGIAGGGAGQLNPPEGVATDSSGDVYVADDANERIDEFSAAGAFIKAYGWGVVDGASQFETCTSTCQVGTRRRRRRGALRPLARRHR